MKKYLFLILAAFAIVPYAFSTPEPQSFIDRLVESAIPELYIVNASNKIITVKIDGQVIYRNEPGHNANLTLKGRFGRQIRLAIEIPHQGLFGTKIEQFHYDFTPEYHEHWYLTVGNDASTTTLNMQEK